MARKPANKKNNVSKASNSDTTPAPTSPSPPPNSASAETITTEIQDGEDEQSQEQVEDVTHLADSDENVDNPAAETSSDHQPVEELVVPPLEPRVEASEESQQEQPQSEHPTSQLDTKEQSEDATLSQHPPQEEEEETAEETGDQQRESHSLSPPLQQQPGQQLQPLSFQQNLFTPPQPTQTPSSTNFELVSATGELIIGDSGDQGNDDDDEELDLGQFTTPGQELALPVLNSNQSLQSTGTFERASSSLSHSPSMAPLVEEGEEKKKAEGEEEPKLDPVSCGTLFRFATKFDVFLIIVGTLASLINGFMLPLSSLLMGEVLNRMQDDFDAVIREICFLFFALGVISLVCGLFQTFCFTLSSERQGKALRDAYLKALLRQDQSWHDTQPAGKDVASKISEFTSTVQGGLGDKLGTIVSSLFSFVFALFLAFSKGWELSLVLLIPLPVLFVLITILMQKLSQLVVEEQKAYAKANVLAVETFDNIATVKVFKMQGGLIKKYKFHLIEAYNLGKRMSYTNGFVFMFFLMLMFSMYALGIYWGGVQLMAKGKHTFGPNSPLYNGGLIISIFYVLLSAMQSVGGSMQSFSAIARARASMAQLTLVIDRQSDIDPFDFSEAYAVQRREWINFEAKQSALKSKSQKTSKRRPQLSNSLQSDSASSDYHSLDDAMVSINDNHTFDSACNTKTLVTRLNFTGGIKFENVTFKYPSRPTQTILNKFSFEFEPFKNYGIVGSSGCGKSTLFQLIQRLYDPESGSVLIQIFDGIDPAQRLSSVSARPSLLTSPTRWVDLKDIYIGPWRKHCVGLVTQEPPLMPGTIADNIRLGAPHASSEDIVAVSMIAHAHDFIMKKRDQYNYYLSGPGSLLSGGQAQRIGLARCLLMKPALLLLDEYTSALDYSTEGRLTQNMSTLRELPPTSSTDIESGQNLSESEHVSGIGGRHVKSSLTIAHRLVTVRNSLILGMKDGVLAEFGTHADLLENHPNGVYAQMFNAHPDPSLTGALKEIHGDDTSTKNNGAKQFLIDAERAVQHNNIKIRASNFIKSTDKHLQDQKTSTSVNRSARAFRFTPLVKHIFSSHPFLMFIALVSIAVGGASFPGFAFIFGHALKALYEPSVEELKKGVKKYALYFITFALAAGFNNFITYSILGVVSEKVIAHFRAKLYSNLIQQEMGFFDQETNSTGILTTKLAKDTSQIRQFITQFGQQCLSFIAQLVITFAMSYRTSPKGTWIMCLIFPLSALASYLHFRFVRGFAAAAKEHLESAGTIAISAMKNVRLVASFNVENWTCIQFSHLNDDALWTGMVSGLYGGFGFGLSQFCFYTATALIYWFGGRLVIDGDLSFNDFFQISQSMRFASQQFSIILSQMSSLDAMNAAISDMYDLMDRPTLDDAYVHDNITTSQEAKESLLKTGKYTPITKGHVEFKKVKFHYPTTRNLPLLRGISFNTSKKGKSSSNDESRNFILALVGASGNGKSTIMNLLLQFYQPIQENGNSRLIINKKQEYYNKFVRSKYNSDGLKRDVDELQQSLLSDQPVDGRNVNSGPSDHVIMTVNDIDENNTDEIKVEDMSPTQRNEYAKKRAHDFEHGGDLRDPERSGQILIDGIDIMRIPLDTLYDYISFVPQQPQIFNQSVLNNIRCNDESISLELVTAAAKKAQIHDIIVRLPEKYDTIIDSKKLSTGQKQRICIARALVRDPVILCLDEASSGLDAVNSKKVHLALEEAMKGKVTLTIAHRLETIAVADSILVLDKGEIVESGTHQELLDFSKKRVEQGLPEGVYATFLDNSVSQ